MSSARADVSSPGRKLVARAFDKAIADGELTNEEREILDKVVKYVAETEGTTRDDVLKEVGLHLKIHESVLFGMCKKESESFFTQYLLGFIVTLLPTQFMFREHCKHMLTSPFKIFSFLPVLIIMILLYVWLANLADLFIRLLRLFGILNFWSFLWTDAALLHMGQRITEITAKVRTKPEFQKMSDNLMKYVDYLGNLLASEQGKDALRYGDFCLPDTFLNATLTDTCALEQDSAEKKMHWSLQLESLTPKRFTSAAHNQVRQVLQDSMSRTGNGVADEKIMEWFEHAIDWLPKMAMYVLCELKRYTVGNLNRFADSQNSCRFACQAFCTVLCVFTMWTLWQRCFASRESSRNVGGGRCWCFMQGVVRISLFLIASLTTSMILIASFFPQKENMHVQECNSWLNDTWYWLSVWKGCEDFSLLLLALFFAWLIEQFKEKIQGCINPRLLTWSATLHTGAGSSAGAGASSTSYTGAGASAGAGGTCSSAGSGAGASSGSSAGVDGSAGADGEASAESPGAGISPHAGDKRPRELERSLEEPLAKKQKPNGRPAAAAASGAAAATAE